MDRHQCSSLVAWPRRGALPSSFYIDAHRHNERCGQDQHRCVSSHIKWLHRRDCIANLVLTIRCSDDNRGRALCTWLKGCRPPSSRATYGHTQCNIPYLVRTAQSSHCRPRQYYGGGPRGNPGCRRLSFFSRFFSSSFFLRLAVLEFGTSAGGRPCFWHIRPLIDFVGISDP